MSHKLTVQLTIKILLWFALCVLLFVLSAPLRAESATEIRASKSISYTSEPANDKARRDEQLKQTDTDLMPALQVQGFRAESTVMALQVENASYYPAEDIYIYDATTHLISDFNENGFYHRFSVMIDADTIYEVAHVYVRLYLSYEGGPWNHYATSNTYHISGESELDYFTVETELANGYIPGYYDIRIELYNADHDSWLFSYGPYDDASLRTLPLEDSFYDDLYQTAAYYPVETEVIVTGHGHGSMSWWLFILPALISLLRLGVKHYSNVCCS
jgi:hypothetical protein